MRSDDFFDDDQANLCDEEAFSGSLHMLGTSQIYDLFKYRAAHCPDMSDSTFFALIETLLSPFKEFLSDEQHEELWEWVYMMQYELCQERDPAVDYDTCKDQVNQHRSTPRTASPKPPGPVGSRKKKRRK
jgi:hypothetical protein